ncbi:hypothetical protein [Bacillus thuringiensis]|uniref:hypothetical protein n=1 Tax=Bacillus thuringiensis TaxID=1428 RepID=UPI003F6D857C
MRLFVAIDVSSEKLDVCFIDSHDTCFRNPKLALASRRNYMASSYPVGILSVDFTWNDFT